MKQQLKKMTEDKTIILLLSYLRGKGWSIGEGDYCLKGKRGIDLRAKKGDQLLLIEVKGAKARKNAPTRKRIKFSCGQVKTHLGVAIVKMIELRIKHPDAILAIAHPNDPEIREWIGDLIPTIINMGFNHYWVSSNGKVEEINTELDN